MADLKNEHYIFKCLRIRFVQKMYISYTSNIDTRYENVLNFNARYISSSQQRDLINFSVQLNFSFNKYVLV